LKRHRLGVIVKDFPRDVDNDFTGQVITQRDNLHLPPRRSKTADSA
jgi:hypothetical protein